MTTEHEKIIQLAEEVSYFIGFYDGLKWIKHKKPSKWFKEYNVERHLKTTNDKSLLKRNILKPDSGQKKWIKRFIR